MPTASGAVGRVDVGEDASATWTRDGLKRGTKPPNRNCNSYLQRYQEQKKRNKSHLLQGVQNNTDQSDQNDGAKEENPQENDTSDDPTSGKLTSGEGSKKSVIYQEQEKKSHLLQGVQNNTDQSDQNDGAKEENPQENDTSDDPTSGKLTSGEGSKKSVMCVLL